MKSATEDRERPMLSNLPTAERSGPPAAEGVRGEGRLFVVGLGASAGGLEALRSFFNAMPAASGMAFVVIQHLSPEHKSMMAELLSRNTQMPVSRAKDDVKVEPNHVYLIPPKKCLQIAQGKLVLTDWNMKPGPNLPIDTFFSSLAEDCGDRAIAIALSGTGSDGTRGIRAIKEAGGLVMIQDEESAKFSGMPHSAIASGLADYVLPAEDMPKALLSFIKHPLLTRSRGSGLGPAPDTMQKIEGLVRAETGIDFSGYKQSTVLRRLERRLGISQVENAEQYLEYLQQTPSEVGAFAKDLLISVTRFFRDREAFERLRHGGGSLFPWHSASRACRDSARTLQREDLRFGCEPGSDRVCRDGHLPGQHRRRCSSGISRPLFYESGDRLRISQEIRDRIIFATNDVLQDPPFTRLDLISCRNLLIYL
ncbi:MAG TPA: chemotaxis protein CheB, partial [Candidatus Acidoferrum sp.]|nr:chemotaxis protein CheB [Candidatus Acidoferrum sp.]